LRSRRFITWALNWSVVDGAMCPTCCSTTRGSLPPLGGERCTCAVANAALCRRAAAETGARSGAGSRARSHGQGCAVGCSGDSTRDGHASRTRGRQARRTPRSPCATRAPRPGARRSRPRVRLPGSSSRARGCADGRNRRRAIAARSARRCEVRRGRASQVRLGARPAARRRGLHGRARRLHRGARRFWSGSRNVRVRFGCFTRRRRPRAPFPLSTSGWYSSATSRICAGSADRHVDGGGTEVALPDLLCAHVTLPTLRVKRRARS
jgi:hypothetical protein